MEILKDELTEGELVIEQYLRDELYKFEVQKEIVGLKGDNTRTFRRADFYIKEYDIYLEFLGMWNKGEQYRQEYRDKMRVYNANNIACVYLWPDNLGFIKQALNYRIERELRAKKKFRHLAKFKRFRLNRHTNNFQFIWFFLVALLTLWTTRESTSEWPMAIRASIIFTLTLAVFLFTVYLVIAFTYSLLIRLGLDEKYGKKLQRILELPW